MQQVFLIVAAMVLGLTAAKVTGGFAFSPLVCVTAGLLFVTPVLFQFHMKDFRLLKDHKKVLVKNFLVNLALLPAVAFLIGYATGDFGMTGALVLLALLPGGGMVMHWVRKSGANVKTGFLIFFVNLAMLLPVYTGFQIFTEIYGSYLFGDLFALKVAASGAYKEIAPIGPFMILIVFPLIVSRFVLKYAPEFPGWVEGHRKLVSGVGVFGIVFYLFGLESSLALFDLAPLTVLKAVVATGLFYGTALLLANNLVGDDPEEGALFWHVVTRFITLALIIATFVGEIYGPTFLLPVMAAYFVQIALASFVSTKHFEKRENA